MLENLFHFHSQRPFLAASETLSELGYSRSYVRRDFEIAVSVEEPRWAVDAVAFSDSVAHIENACVTVLNLTSTGLDRASVADRLRRTTAPFHLVYNEGRGFDIWADAKPEMVTLAESVVPDRLSEALREYSADFRPATVQRVKRGLESFAHERLAALQPLQGLLWAEGVNCELLAAHFRHALDELKRAGIRDQLIQSRLAAQLLTSRILADTRAMESCDRVKDIPEAAAQKKFVAYFDAKLLKKLAGPAQQAYDLFRQISFATFQPEMLRTLYKSLYTAEQSRAKGRFDTPLWLTRRIWREIPIEFLPPEQRVVADLTCGWGSFLISAVERFSVLPDMGNRRFSHYIFGNDDDETTAELARVALLTSTGRDSWQVDHEDGREWNLPKQKKPGVIVGNPPFLGDRKRQTAASTGGRRHELANDFLHRAVDALADGGYLAMVMPGSFVASESGPAVRKALLERCDIHELWEIPGSVFDNAQVQPMVVFARKVKGKSTPSVQPVRTRICQKNEPHVESFKRNGVFTRSDVFPDQSRWTEGRRGGKTTHIFDYTSLLNDAEWQALRAGCVSLEDIAEIVPGCIKGSLDRCRPTGKRPRKVTLLSKAGATLPSEFVFDESAAETVSYPNHLEEPRVDSVALFEGQKILLLSDPNPSWGKRMKLGLERNGAFPGAGFFAIAPNTDCLVSLECLAAVLRWKVSNAWVVEHLRYPKINKSILGKVPVPKVLLADANFAKLLKSLLLKVERAAIAGRGDDSAEAEMDAILRKAYGITDESMWQRLCAVYRWDEIGDLTPSFDLPAVSIRTDWSVEGSVEAVDVAKGTLTLWMSGFDDLQTVPLCPQFPGWMLRAGVKFRTMIPAAEARRGRVSGKAWGVFEPANYTYLSVEQMTDRLNTAMKRRGA